MIEESILPDGWCWATLSDLGYWSGGGTPSKAREEFWTGGDIPWVSPKDMKTLLITDTEDHLSTKALEETALKLCSSGTILIVVRSGILQRILPVAVCQVPVTMNQDMKALSPIDGVDSMYVAYYLMSSERNILSNCSKDGTTVASIESEALKAYPIPLSPTTEQRRIVTAIEQQFTRLDAAVTALQHARTKLKRYRAAVLKAAVEGKLTEAWRAEHPATEPASALLERILVERRAKWEADQRAKGKDPVKGKYVEPARPDAEDLSKLPEEWCWATLGQAANFQNGRPFPSNAYTSEGFKLLRPGNLFADGTVKWTESNTRCMPEVWAERNLDLIVRGHELVMNLTAQSLKDEFLGRVCITSKDESCLLNQRLARIFPLSELDPLYTLYMLKSTIFRRFVDGLNKGSLIQHMFTSQLTTFCFPLPPFLEQQQIVAEVERRLSIVNQLEEIVEVNLKRAERMRQSILKEAFAGRLVPQDPTDEPASTLLERIHKEREEKKPGPIKKSRELKTITVPRMPDVESVDIDASEMEQMDLWTSIGRRE